MVDFSIISSFDYYTGMVFRGLRARMCPHRPGKRRPLRPRRSTSFGRDEPAAGFAIVIEQRACRRIEAQGVAPLRMSGPEQEINVRRSRTRCSRAPKELSARRESASCWEVGSTMDAAQYQRIAVPKGSLFDDTVALLGEAGLGHDGPRRTPAGASSSRTRASTSSSCARPMHRSSSPTAEPTAASAARTRSSRRASTVLELVDLKYGYCRFVVAEPEAAAVTRPRQHYERLGVLRVATKYPRHHALVLRGQRRAGRHHQDARQHRARAASSGMADRIVDITATGTTLRENHLRVVRRGARRRTARFIANPAAVRTDARVIELACAARERRRDDETDDVAVMS